MALSRYTDRIWEKMGRPVQFDRDDALQVAMDEFWRHGYEATSVKSLSEILGITRSSFYNSFGSRDALFIEALDLYNSESPDRAFGEAGRGVPIKALITRVFKAACHARATDPEARGCLFVCSVAELSNVVAHPELSAHLNKMVLGSVARIEELLNWAVTQSELPKTTDTHALALTVQSLLMGLNVLCKAVPNEKDLWRAARFSLDQLGLYEDAPHSIGLAQ